MSSIGTRVEGIECPKCGSFRNEVIAEPATHIDFGDGLAPEPIIWIGARPKRTIRCTDCGKTFKRK